MFADCLRSLREKAGISQYRLAKRSGVSKHMVSRLELGTTQPSWETVQRLATALGVDCRSFVDPDLPMPEETAIRGRGPAPLAQTHVSATQEGHKAGPLAFPQERSRHVLSDVQAGGEQAVSAPGDRPTRPGRNVDILIALDPELDGLIRWFEANLCRLPREPFRLFEWSEWTDPKGLYERCTAACEAIKRNNPTPDSPQWLQRYLSQLRERFERRL
jgi:transcriptional regulator with XRE-family HTH domain